MEDSRREPVVVASPIWHTIVGPHRCRHGHPILPRNGNVSARGSLIWFVACSKCTPSTYALGFQNGVLDLITWYATDEPTFDLLANRVDPATHALVLLSHMKFHQLGPSDLHLGAA
jgi:hypothetical protein